MECSAKKEETTMELPITFFMVTVLFLLIGVLGGRGVLLKDLMFTGYLLWFLLATAGLWVFMQTKSPPRLHETAYLFLYGASLLLAMAVMLRHPQGWHPVLLGSLCAVVCFWLGWGDFPRATVLEAASCFIHLSLGLYALTQSFSATPGFEVVKLRGLGLFWLGQLGASAIYVAGVLRGQQPQKFTTDIAAAVGAMAILWMALTFWFGGGQAWSGVPVEDKKDSDRGGWLEVQGELARGKARVSLR